MFAGHFGVAAVVKGKAKNLPLWSLIVSSQLLDIVFVPLSLIGLEGFGNQIEGGRGTVIYAEYSHSLLGAILLSIIAGVVATRYLGKQSGMVIGYVTFSHWIIDLIVHVPDLPILPGNLGDFPYLGFGFWQFPMLSLFLEGLLIIIGAFVYFRYAYRLSGEKRNSKGILKGSLMALLLIVSFVFGI